VKVIFKVITAFSCLLAIGTSKLNAQTSIAFNSLLESFEKHTERNLHEKIFVHTDKIFYLAGERIWMKFYIVDALFHKPISVSRVIYAEILDSEGKAVSQTKISADQGSGSGSFLLPSSVSSGSYILRAYTQWMRNFNSSLFYEKRISIINTVHENAFFPDKESSLQADVQFFPEGGTLLSGVKTKMAFKVLSPDGKGSDAAGFVINQKGDTITKFSTFLFGAGSFYITPQKGDQYRAVVKFSDKIVTKMLPDAQTSGYSIALTKGDNNQLSVTINFSEELNYEEVYLLAHSRQIIRHAEVILCKKDKAIVSIDNNNLADGVTHITLFNKNKKPVCERLYFKKPVNASQFVVETDKANYKNRDRVSVIIKNVSKSNLLAAANLSMSVYLTDSLEMEPNNNIESYFLLESNLKGEIESPSFYFSGDKGVDVAADNLMLTQGWRRFKWENVLGNDQAFIEFKPEYEGILVNAKVTDLANGQPLAAMPVYLSLPGRDFKFLNSTSDKDGKVSFPIKSKYESGRIIMQTVGNNLGRHKIAIDNPFSTSLPSTSHSLNNFHPSMRNQLLTRHLGVQIENAYGVDVKKKYRYIDSTIATFYSAPAITFYLDNYTRFKTMEEVIREIVTDVRMRKRGNDFYCRVFDRTTKIFFENDPLILFDGLPIFDINVMVTADPAKVWSIDVVPYKYHIGIKTYEGVVSFRTYNGDIGGLVVDKGAFVVNFDALQQQREFYSPDYKNQLYKESRIPDFRNVLLWKPDIIINDPFNVTLDFYTSDVKGKFLINVQGVTEEGKPISILQHFIVKD
jgi:hypothetical protein